MKLFSYQEKVIEAIRNDPSHSQLISMPTGTGKTITFLHAIKDQNKKCLILVHREELMEQTYDKARLCGYEKEDLALVKAKSKEKLSKLNIAMVQTLARNLTLYDPKEIEMVVIDEAHHATANSYRTILDHFQVFAEKKLLLGFTATPLRGDKQCLSAIFTSHSFKMTLSEATQQGYIVPVHGLRIDMEKSLKEIDTISGDYDISQLDKVMNCEDVNNIIAERCQYLKRTPTIIFCTSVDHAEKIAKKIRSKKRKAISISYKTPKRTLKQTMGMVKENRVDFITNAIKLSEGFDHPSIRTVVIARPTRSPVLYKQMIGRGLRKYPNKEDCFVMEFSGSDPKMICWEDIDENCTFQCKTLKEKSTYEQAKNHYKTIFRNSDLVEVVDVRISPFNFYECKIIRCMKYKKTFLFVPFTHGFSIFNLVIDKKDTVGNYFFCFATFLMWKEDFKSFYPYQGELNEEITKGRGRPINQIKDFIMGMSRKQFQKWYPSEEEPMTREQKKHYERLFGKKSPSLSARKAEMEIEDRFIKLAIDKYWIPEKFEKVMTI